MALERYQAVPDAKMPIVLEQIAEEAALHHSQEYVITVSRKDGANTVWAEFARQDA